MCQNILGKVLLTEPKLHAKVQSRSGVFIQGDWQKYIVNKLPRNTLPRCIENHMNMSTVIAVSQMVHYDTLFSTCDRLLLLLLSGNCSITKCNLNASGCLLQNASVLLQNASLITKWVGTRIFPSEIMNPLFPISKVKFQKITISE